MMTTHDLDAQLKAMFAAQAVALDAPAREWTDATQMAPVRSASRRRAYIVGVAAFSAAAVTLGVVAVGSSTDQTVDTKAPAAAPAPVTSPPTTPPALPFRVETKQVSLAAQALQIDLVDPQKGERTFATAAPIEVHGDPGMVNEYTTLELTWRELDVEMRLNIYFKSDGRQWWSDEIRTYDGRKQGEWITYTGDYFRSPLGSPFVGDFETTAKDHGISGTLRLPGLRLEGFRRPAACTNPTAPFALDSGVDTVEISKSPMTGYGLNARLLDTATCLPVADEASFTVTWKTGDPAIATLTSDGLRADLQAQAIGVTAAQVSAVGPAGQVVRGATVEVRVVPPEPASGPTTAKGKSPTP